MKYQNIREEELKIKISQDYFWQYDCSKIVGNVDFCVCVWQNDSELFEQESLLWAEAKKGSSDIYKSITQLILTIGKARTFDKILPPSFLAAFDAEKFAFLPYNTIQDIFYQNDFNWNVTPSNTDTNEFKQVYEKVKSIIDDDTLIFYYEKDDKELKNFIKNNFIIGKFGVTKTRIDKNNFITIYNKWYETVKPTIVVNWELAKEDGIIDGDFYLADLLSSENETLKEKLFVLLHNNYYEADKHKKKYGFFTSSRIEFSDNQKAHTQFWNKYERPPLEEYWNYIIDRRDLIVPQDVRERKGSFYTPRIWVEKSQEYLADVFGQDWQDEYYIWDCAAGTGNLLADLVNKDRIWASTLDKQDVAVMLDRIENGANLWKQQVFQFDFLNDDFLPISKGGKLPDELYNIISDEKKRKKLVIYINPPYADASSNMKSGKKAGNSFNKTYEKYRDNLGNFARELYAQFLIRIYFEIPNCKIAEFSKLKLLSVTHAEKMRNCFLAKLEKIFIIPANTFDNVVGKFPIGFKIWDLSKKEKFNEIKSDVFDEKNNKLEKKTIYSYDEKHKINRWITEENEKINGLGYISLGRNDFQNKNLVFIINEKSLATNYSYPINIDNLIKVSIYFSVQKVISSTWLNDRDQFLYPNKKWEKDIEFHNNCLTYTLFNNNISTKYGVNHWIPFMETEINTGYKLDSHFMSDFTNGKLIQNGYSSLFEQQKNKMCIKREFSLEATAVFNAGRELWKYYHAQPNININASLYDIKEYFQGRNENGKMNNKSEDAKYNELMKNLREKLEILAQKIEPKVYEYEFLK